MEKSVEHNPNFEPVAHRLMAMLKVKAGLVQEGQDMFATYAKKWPDSIMNIRYYMSRAPLKDTRVLQSWAEGYIRAGFPGELDDVYKIARENKLSDDELRRLFLGHKVTGIELTTGKQWWVDRSKNGKTSIREGDKSDTGKSWVEDGMLCDQWDNIYEGLRDCWVIYRNPEGTPENHDEYLGAPGYGIYPFSLVE